MTEDERINTYKPCKAHGNGHSPDCKDCEVDCLRGLLREVVSCPDHFEQEDQCYLVEVPAALWNKIIPLRTPAVVVAKHAADSEPESLGLQDDVVNGFEQIP
jgi:hypothetical protein